MAQHRLKATAETERLETIAAADSTRSREANQRADNSMLAVVLFASALFFAGLSTNMQTLRARRVILGLGGVVFLGTVNSSDVPGPAHDVGRQRSIRRRRGHLGARRPAAARPTPQVIGANADFCVTEGGSRTAP
jgi:hypothetical protein